MSGHGNSIHPKSGVSCRASEHFEILFVLFSSMHNAIQEKERLPLTTKYEVIFSILLIML